MNVELLETCLLVGRWNDEISETHPVAKLAKAVVDGDFRSVLTSTYAQQAFTVHPAVSLDNPFVLLLQWALPDVSDPRELELARLVLAIACLHAFVQANWTGPNLDLKPSDVLVFTSGSHSPTLTDASLHAKAIAELAYGGEPAYHLAQHAPFLRWAQILLGDAHPVHLRYTPWWRMRIAIVHQRVLDEPVPLPPDVLDALTPLVVHTESGPDLDLAGRLQLELGLFEHVFTHDKAAAGYFVRAARATGLQYELTGALGKRTKFQQNALTQLVLLAESRPRTDDAQWEPTAVGVSPAADSEETGGKGGLPETLPLNDDTLLEQTEFTSSNPASTDMLRHLDPTSQPALHPLDQCILLSLCLNVRNTSPLHGLTNEQMSPYVARVISHPRNWSVHTMALLLRSRLESTRTRTVERSTLQLQALVDQMPTADSSLPERLFYFHTIPLPSKWEMERELAQRYLSIGVVKSALEIFERLEMWEQVVQCWQSMDRRDRALAIVCDLLQGRKEEAERVIAKSKEVSAVRRTTIDSAREAKLWCLLGDLEPEQAVAHYEHAWKLSRETSGRAVRSLGGYYFARGEFEQVIACLVKAVAINPLLTRPWFILGCAYIRMENWAGARDAFTRCVAIDDEDGESWNNLATIYLRLDEAGKVKKGDDIPAESSDNNAVPFSNKTLAFRALKQGLKYRYENWRMWSNYMIVAVDVGELSEACRAQARIVEERAAKVGVECVDESVLTRLVDAVTRESPVVDPDANHVLDADATQTRTDVDVEQQRDAVRYPNEGRGLLRRVLDLFDHTILPRVSSARIFYIYARLLTWQARWQDALQAHLDSYRCGAAGTFGQDCGSGDGADVDVDDTTTKWRDAVREVEEIVDVLQNFGPRVEGYNWRHQARSIVRTFIGRAKAFQDEPEWTRVLTIQEELRRAA